MSNPLISEPSLKSTARKIGWFTASCVLVSNIIGGGIFTTTGLMARDLGDPMLILLLWFVGALFALGGAMVYGELGAALPHAEGTMSICERPMDRWWPFSVDGLPLRSALARQLPLQPSVFRPMRCVLSQSKMNRDGWRRVSRSLCCGSQPSCIVGVWEQAAACNCC